MAVRRKSLQQLEMSGAMKKNPQRFRAPNHTQTSMEGVGKPPRWLKPEVKRAWKDLVAAIPPGTACISDRIALELASTMLAKHRQGLWGKASEVTCLTGLLAKFGLTPIDRERLGLPAAVESTEDEWAFVLGARRLKEVAE